MGTEYKNISKMIIIVMAESLYHCLNLPTVIKIRIIDMKLMHLLS